MIDPLCIDLSCARVNRHRDVLHTRTAQHKRRGSVRRWVAVAIARCAARRSRPSSTSSATEAGPALGLSAMGTPPSRCTLSATQAPFAAPRRSAVALRDAPMRARRGNGWVLTGESTDAAQRSHAEANRVAIQRVVGHLERRSDIRTCRLENSSRVNTALYDRCHVVCRIATCHVVRCML